MAAVENPTYMEHIRLFFADEDHKCMFPLGKDYTTYDSLKTHAVEAYSITRPPKAKMPKPLSRRWSKDKSDTFLNWILNGHVRGEPKLGSVKVGNVARTRRSVTDLDQQEIDKLKLAFQGLMDRDIDHPQSYFQIASIHGLPNIKYCQHGTPHYHMWHRAYLLRFEDALRSVPGCENVTLPYWDFAERLPTFFNHAPFKSYSLPRAASTDFPKGYPTTRYTPATIEGNFETTGVLETIDEAMLQSSWEQFNSIVEGAHNNAHPSCGSSLTHADVAAYDPLFWFFHANWDRLWWRWQHLMQATTIWKFRSTLSDTSTASFLAPPLNGMNPNFMNADETIDSHALGVTYTMPLPSLPSVALSVMAGKEIFGSLPIKSLVNISDKPQVSVRVKGIDRLAIPGSFRLKLIANGKVVAQRSHFQFTTPNDCPTCRNSGKIDIDFMVPIDMLIGATMKVDIDVFGLDGVPRPFPVSSAGNPTVNARLPLHRG